MPPLRSELPKGKFSPKSSQRSLGKAANDPTSTRTKWLSDKSNQARDWKIQACFYKKYVYKIKCSLLITTARFA